VQYPDIFVVTGVVDMDHSAVMDRFYVADKFLNRCEHVGIKSENSQAERITDIENCLCV